MRDDAIRGVKWSALQNWGSRLTTTLLFILLARLLAPADFGLVALASVFIAFFAVFQDQGLGRTIVQRDVLEDDDIDSAFWFGLGAGAVLTVLVAALAPLAATVFAEPRLTPILRWLSLNFVLGGLNGTPTALLQRELRFEALATRGLVATLLSGVLGVALAAMGAGVWALVAQNLARPAISTVVLWLACSWRPRARFSFHRVRELTRFGVNILALDLLSFVNRRSDDLLIGAVLGPVALGYYSVAYRLLLLMTEVFTQTVSAVALPVFSRMQRDLPRMKRTFYAATRMSAAIAFPAFVGVAVIAPEFVTVVFGDRWAPSIPVMRALAFIGIVHSVAYFNRAVMIAAGRPGHALMVAAVNAVTNVAVFLVVVRWGIVAVAIGYSIRGWLLAPLPLVILRRFMTLEWRVYLRQLAPPMAAAAVMAAAVWGLNIGLGASVEDAVRLVIAVPTGAAVYALTLRLLAPAFVREIVQVVTSSVDRQQASNPTHLS